MLSLAFKLRVRPPSKATDFMAGGIGAEKLVLQDSGLLAWLFWRQEKGKEIQWTFLPLKLNF